MPKNGLILYSSILLLEDDPDDCSMFRDIINGLDESSQIEVRVAKNGAEGLSLIKQKIPDIIFSDVNMPVMDGFQFALAIYDSFPSLKVPIVFMSTADLKKDMAYAEMLNVVHYIRKPETVAQLEEEVIQALRTQFI
ncbi:response regulator [Chitinophaga barathri]|nr:response regulator [Chitinophaga barathri]